MAEPYNGKNPFMNNVIWNKDVVLSDVRKYSF